MSATKRRPKLPRAVTGRRRLFAGRFDDIAITDGRIVVVPAAVLSLTNKELVVHLLERVPREDWIVFSFRGSIEFGPEEGAFFKALKSLWRQDEAIDPQLSEMGDELLDEFVALLEAKAPGAFSAALGAIFRPVTP